MQSEKRQGADLGPPGPLFIHEGGTIGNTLSLLIPLRAGATSQAAILCLATRVFELLLPLPLVAMEAASANPACQQSRLLCQRLSQSTFPVSSGQHTPRGRRVETEKAAVMPGIQHSGWYSGNLSNIFQNRPPPRSSLTCLFSCKKSSPNRPPTFLALFCLCLSAMLSAVDLQGCILRAANGFHGE